MPFVAGVPRAAERLGIAAVFGLFAHTSFAQTEPAECAAAARSVSARAARSAEIEQLASCPNSGPDALKAVWQNAGPVAEPELAALVRSSRKTRDGRVYGAVTWLRSARVGDPPPSAPDAFTGTGSVPLPESRLADFPVLLSRLAHGDRDSSVAQAALRLRQYLALSDPDHTPVPPNAVRLVAGCRNLLSLQSTLDVTIPLHVRVVGTSTERTYTLKRWVSGPPVQLTLDLPPGQVAVTYGNGRELARLADRTGPCPANSRGR
jgi:hypothetical protein